MSLKAGMSAAQDAVRADEAGEYETACQMYEKAVKCMVKASKKEKTAAKRERIDEKVKEYSERLKTLRALMQEQRKKPAKKPEKKPEPQRVVAANLAVSEKSARTPYTIEIDGDSQSASVLQEMAQMAVEHDRRGEYAVAMELYIYVSAEFLRLGRETDKPAVKQHIVLRTKEYMTRAEELAALVPEADRVRLVLHDISAIKGKLKVGRAALRALPPMPVGAQPIEQLWAQIDELCELLGDKFSK